METLFENALTFFLTTNPIGNSPAIIALVKEFPFERQRRILLREGLLALAVALFFQYLGAGFLSMLGIQKYAVTMCGGTLLFIVALNRIFSISSYPQSTTMQQEPMLVPIATPLLSGPGLLAIIMLKSNLERNWFLSLAIVIAWIGVLAVLVAAPYLQRLTGKRGMAALEQLMGLVLSLIAMNMLMRGIGLFIETLGQSPGQSYG
ncbi:MAG: MarC family protein [Parachlamydia sp.]|nr:MarC family protein [Parachlamydia sp.]